MLRQDEAIGTFAQRSLKNFYTITSRGGWNSRLRELAGVAWQDYFTTVDKLCMLTIEPKPITGINAPVRHHERYLIEVKTQPGSGLHDMQFSAHRVFVSRHNLALLYHPMQMTQIIGGAKSSFSLLCDGERLNPEAPLGDQVSFEKHPKFRGHVSLDMMTSQSGG